MSDPKQSGFEKRVIELPDGRILIYYDFEAPAPASSPSPGSEGGDDEATGA